MKNYKTWISNPDKFQGGLILNPEIENQIRAIKSTHPILKDLSDQEFEDSLEGFMVHLELYIELPDSFNSDLIKEWVDLYFEG